MATMFPAERMQTIMVLAPMLINTGSWDKRWLIESYVSRCILAGFCKTDDQIRHCAERYIAGKRKVNPPGTARRKKAEQELKKIIANTPPELAAAISTVIAEQTKAVEQYKAGNEKVLNSLVGGVMKKHKADPAIVRQLLVIKLKE